MRSLWPQRQPRSPLADCLALTLVLVCSALSIPHAAAAPATHGPAASVVGVGFKPANLAGRIGQQPNAQERPGHDQRDSHDPAAQNHPEITPQQAAQRARRRFGGRVLNVILEREPEGPYYRVKLLKHGRVRVVSIDARR